MKYNPDIVFSFFKEEGLPEPVIEYCFHQYRKWRWDFSWPHATRLIDDEERNLQVLVRQPLALEIQGGIWSHGRHIRGAALLKEWEKLNEAAALGWRVIYCQPNDLCTLNTVNMIKRCLEKK